jgi:hypothetical protein
MVKDNDLEQKYEMMRGVYLSTMASVEYELTILITELIKVTYHREEFVNWFVQTPIPFNCKAELFAEIVKEDPQLDHYRTLILSLRSLNNFRNTLAHSFNSFDSLMSSRGEKLPSKKVSFEVLKCRLGELQKAEDLIKYMIDCILEGAHYPISADDIADSPM